MNRAVKRRFKDELFEQIASIGKALASGRRLELLDLLAQRQRTVEELATETSMSVANCSQHLQVLRGAHLVDVRRAGLYAHYRLSDESVLRLWLSFRAVGETRLSEISRIVETYLTDRKSLQAITTEELLERLTKRSVVVLDVRPKEEYEAGHIAGARSIPLGELESRLKELPKSREIIAYCRGPYCVFADEALSLLRERGFRARRLAEGFPEWQVQGLPSQAGREA
jgi:rhodanese-related sulfurtransferase